MAEGIIWGTGDICLLSLDEARAERRSQKAILVCGRELIQSLGIKVTSRLVLPRSILIVLSSWEEKKKKSKLITDT